jgi:hypothetical protein
VVRKQILTSSTGRMSLNSYSYSSYFCSTVEQYSRSAALY